MAIVLRAAVLSLMLVLLVAGCSGGDGTDQGDSAAQTDAAEQVTTDHPAADHPTADHPDTTKAATDHPK